MNQVTLIGLTQHGKNRVKEQGPLWKIKNVFESVLTARHRNCQGPFLLIENDRGDTRIVARKDDPDFIVAEGWEDA